METIRLQEEIVQKGSYDVLVAGGGIAGVSAAVAAARMGKSVLLVEKSMKLGGLATLGLINLFVPMCNGRGKQIIFGMAEELCRLSVRYGYGDIPGEFVNGQIPREILAEYQKKGEKPPRYAVRYSADIFALCLTEWCREAGVELLFDSVISRPVMDKDNPRKIRGVVVENKSGREYYAAKMFVDVTGDADLMDRAGMPTVKRGSYHTYWAFQITLDSCRRAVEQGDIFKAPFYATGGGVNLYGDGQPEDIPLYDGTRSEEVNRYLITNQLELLEKLKKTDRKTRDIVNLPGMAQFRTSRRLDADYALQETDTYRHFADSVGAICDFDRRDYLFEIPYSTLVRTGWDNIITAGRSAAADGYAWDVLRVIPPAILSAQAAGVACAQAIDAGCPIWNVDIPSLQEELQRQNVIIHFDDGDVPEHSENVIEYND